MRSIRLIATFLIYILLSSCEGSLKYIGQVYDKRTNKPLENVQVKWQFYNGNPTEKVRLVYDSVSEAQRLQYRKLGIKDDFTYWCCPLDDSIYRSKFNVVTHGNPPGMTSWPPNKRSNYQGPYYQYGGKDNLRHLVDCFTDKNGVFLSGPMLVGMVFGAPKIKLLFSKAGYRTLIMKPTRGRYDSIIVYMEEE